jgi:outer membrane protein assembly factor BamE (lipoprotein component of BamABCDE complex)
LRIIQLAKTASLYQIIRQSTANMKTKNYLKMLCFPLLCAAALLLAGCATDNNDNAKQTAPAKDTRPPEERLKVGMSKDEVRQALGNPKGTTVSSQGVETWQYNDNAKVWIPFYAVSGGKFRYTIINFDAEGKVKDWSTSDHAMF